MAVPLDLQYVGGARLADGRTVPVMLNRDADSPSRVTVTWNSNQGIRAGGFVAEVEQAGRRLILHPRVLLRPTEGGGLANLPLADEAERRLRDESKVTLDCLDDGGILGDWTGPDGHSGSVSFPPLTARSVVPTACSGWEEFKAWVVGRGNGLDLQLYRGHGCSDFRLTTSLHRAGRSRLDRFCFETLPDFRAQAEAMLQTRFRLDDGEDFSSLLGLAQHHGRPTPLLDWSESPYIAAFFAFADALENRSSRPQSAHVRVYGLTSEFAEQCDTGCWWMG